MFSYTFLLIALSLVATLIGLINPDIYTFWLNQQFLSQWMYHIFFLQFFTSQFIHGGIFHFLFNSIFLYYFGTQVENILQENKYILFFMFSFIFIGIWITFLGNPYVNTFGMSGFVLAILTYYTLYLRQQWNPEYKWWITAIVINILLWLTPGISFLGVISGIVYFYIVSIFQKKD